MYRANASRGSQPMHSHSLPEFSAAKFLCSVRVERLMKCPRPSSTALNSIPCFNAEWHADMVAEACARPQSSRCKMHCCQLRGDALYQIIPNRQQQKRIIAKLFFFKCITIANCGRSLFLFRFLSLHINNLMFLNWHFSFSLPVYRAMRHAITWNCIGYIISWYARTRYCCGSAVSFVFWVLNFGFRFVGELAP